ncbi:adenosylcobinamide-GDP ribazoletransferase [Candidatus Hakubella thermalkaliphila]|uniref:Adenosylcobinamide-GDP ribazoletransferase n=1 Tax=Candidatus Hakubella thermalkaliphila TaxID=2754717 RepID=A0A6V8Q8G7_9ACTN|nr:adenosylcobinamide-GDP ribazoletransferase [Candidatus Hakubella thermalkaliphila]GFP40833.1 adenosylcobinamide-GDP ribazoletransferase [Candidatus Hakubella thermalkaliphila]
MRSFLVALNFLTILPVPVRDVDGRDLRRSMTLFPLTGLLIGSLLALIFWAGSRIFPSLTIVAFILATEVVISGAMHQDGFMDPVDGLMSGGDQKEILKIMKTGHVGAYAVIAVI